MCISNEDIFTNRYFYKISDKSRYRQPLAFSLIFSRSFSSSNKSFSSFGMFSSSFGIWFVACSHSFVKSSIFDESCKHMAKVRCWTYTIAVTMSLLYLFNFNFKFLDLLLHVLRIFPVFHILPLKLFKLLLRNSEIIIKFLIIQRGEKKKRRKI